MPAFLPPLRSLRYAPLSEGVGFLRDGR